MKIAIIDQSSRSLPYDYFYIKEVSKYFKIEFYCSFTNYNSEFIEEINKLPNVKVVKKHISDRNRLTGAYNYMVLLFYILIKSKEYNKIHFMWSILPLLELPFFILIKNKLFFTFHNDVPHGHKKNFYWFYDKIFKLSQKVIFASHTVKKDFVKNYSIKDLNKIKLLRHGIMSLTINEIGGVKNEGILRKQLIFWGNVKKYKGIDTFLRIAESEYFKNFDLKIFGKWDKELLSLKPILISKGVQIFDSFLTSTELIDLFNENGVFILPYDKATQSGVLYTLLNYNRIFISTNTGDNGAFLIDSGLEKLLFCNKNVDDIKRAVNYCYANETDIKSKLSEKRENFKWKNILHNVETIYNN